MNDNVTPLINKLPDTSKELLGVVWGNLPSDMRHELNLTMDAFCKIAQNNPMALSDLASLLQRQAAPALQPLSNIAVVGPVNVGKSTLFNALLSGTGHTAEVSPIPGTTKDNQSANIGLFTMLDTPGLDHGNSQGQGEKDIAMTAINQANFLIVVFDASRSVTASDRQLYANLLTYKLPILIALNKVDLIPKKHIPAAIQAAAEVLGVQAEEIHPISATRRQGLATLLLEAAAAEPRLLGEMGKAIVPLRRRLSWQVIRRTAITSCIISLTPLPVIDVIPLTAVQGSMVLTLARIYDKPMTIERAGELLTSFGVGLGARAIFQQLSKLGGPPGWALSASIAGAASLAIGWGVMTWFETGIKPDLKATRAMTRKLQGLILTGIKSFAYHKKPTKKLLTEDLEKYITDIEGDIAADSASAISTLPPNPAQEEVTGAKKNPSDLPLAP